MARIRTIKVEFWSDEKIVELCPLARLLFIGLWTFADDDGNLEHSPKQMKMRIFPGDNVNIQALTEELCSHKLVSEYEIDGKKYLNIPNFRKHQRINRPSGSKVPGPPKRKTLTADSQKNSREVEVEVEVDKKKDLSHRGCGIVDNLWQGRPAEGASGWVLMTTRRPPTEVEN